MRLALLDYDINVEPPTVPWYRGYYTKRRSVTGVHSDPFSVSHSHMVERPRREAVERVAKMRHSAFVRNRIRGGVKQRVILNCSKVFYRNIRKRAS